ncbi:hypothetical protein [Streptosporangium sp. NPDC002544]|jgi:hypothetical protein|uniref:hypothetical protein n=1 Tax=unclassified Streptosporangium TaxID=2632669 RepID=UPI0033188F28
MIAAFHAIEHQAPAGDEVFLDVFETISSVVVPLPHEIFNGPHDRRFAPTPDGDGLSLLPQNA